MQLFANYMDNRDCDYIEFTKMHGAGNDYIYINGIESCPANLNELAPRIADRHFGIGGDGLVVILPSATADFRMRMFNADGSEAQMCGNASRCIAKYLHDNQLTSKTDITLETLAGIKILHLNLDSRGEVVSVRVNMGAPRYETAKPVAAQPGEANPGTAQPVVRLEACGRTFEAVAVDMGNPHGVIFTSSLDDETVLHCGPLLECHSVWPEKANIEFVDVADRHNVDMRVWERGTGETLACGTGACAAAVAGILLGRLDSPVQVHLPGGTLRIEWGGTPADPVLMTGPAATVATGRFLLTP